MAKKEYPSVCILDVYFEQMNKNGSWYRISDEELAKLITRVRSLEHEKDIVINRSKYRYRYMDKEIKKWRTLAHVYKVELGRCVRKLTRIYERQLEVAVLAYALGKLNMQPHEYVDIWRQT